MLSCEKLYTRTLRETSHDIAGRVLSLCIIAALIGLGAWFATDKPLYLRGAGIGLASIFIGLCAYEVSRGVRGRNRTLTLSPAGFSDTNIAPETVPWTAVEAVTDVPFYFRGRRRHFAVAVKINDSAWGGLTLTQSAKSNRTQTRGMWIMHIGKQDFQTFLETIKSYARANGGKVD